MFVSAVVEELEVRAVFAFPLAVGGVPLGSLELYRVAPGTLSIEQHAAAAGIAALVGPALIAEAGGDHAAGENGPGSAHIGSGESLSAEFSRSEVHTASGMLAARLGIPVDAASARLRGYAYAQSQPITAVARNVVRRTLDPRTFDDA